MSAAPRAPRLHAVEAHAASAATGEALWRILFGAAGAFALPPGSPDCALLLTLAPGSYTAIVSGLDGSSGAALVEAYQAP